MSQSTAAVTDTALEPKTPANRPAETVRVGNVELALWKNQGKNGDYYAASAPTLRYQDDNGQWQHGTSYSATNLLELAEAAREASAKARELHRGRGQQR